jgi:AcrR family transcriptional regulator
MKRSARPRTNTRLRYDATNAYLRGTQARARLITAGLTLFGSRGYNGASTRDIAAAAGLSAPSLQYYFNDKQGLYRACARDFAGRLWSSVETQVLASERLLRGDARDRSLIIAFCDIQSGLLGGLDGADENWVWLLAREPAGSHKGIRRMRQVQRALIGRLSGLATNDPECLMRVSSLNAPLLSFGLMPRNFPTHRLALLRQVIREQSSVVLRGLIAARPENGAASARLRPVTCVESDSR